MRGRTATGATTGTQPRGGEAAPRPRSATAVAADADKYRGPAVHPPHWPPAGPTAPEGVDGGFISARDGPFVSPARPARAPSPSGRSFPFTPRAAPGPRDGGPWGGRRAAGRAAGEGHAREGSWSLEGDRGSTPTCPDTRPPGLPSSAARREDHPSGPVSRGSKPLPLRRGGTSTTGRGTPPPAGSGRSSLGDGSGGRGGGPVRRYLNESWVARSVTTGE